MCLNCATSKKCGTIFISYLCVVFFFPYYVHKKRTYINLLVSRAIGNLSPLHPPSTAEVDNQGPPVIITEVTPRSENNNPQYCHLSEERNPVRKNPQHILVFCVFEPLPRHTAARTLGSAGILFMPLLVSVFYLIVHTFPAVELTYWT
jgi:hypothetical protein